MNNDILQQILNKVTNIETRQKNMEIQQENMLNLIKSGKFQNTKTDWIAYLNAKYPDEKNLNVKKFGKIPNKSELQYIYNSSMNDLILNKIERNIVNFTGIKSFSKNKNIFIKKNNKWKIINEDDIIQIVTFIKIGYLILTKNLSIKTVKDREFIGTIDNKVSKQTCKTLLENIRKVIYNTIKED